MRLLLSLLFVSVCTRGAEGSCANEDPNADFFLRENRSTGVPVFQSCRWLSVRDDDFIADACMITESNSGIGPAREVCKKTCDSCEAPSSSPSSVPSISPTDSGQPSKYPSGTPSILPSQFPSNEPSLQPSNQPSSVPSKLPSSVPSALPSERASGMPSAQPSDQPSMLPSKLPSSIPSTLPSSPPTQTPTTCYENPQATFLLRKINGNPQFQKCGWLKTRGENNIRNVCAKKGSSGGIGPAREVCMDTCGTCDLMNPSKAPSDVPSLLPSDGPSMIPSKLPSSVPSTLPSASPSKEPSKLPSGQPSLVPSKLPSSVPSTLPSVVPSKEPSKLPSGQPSLTPSKTPSAIPSSLPSSVPTKEPSKHPSDQPTLVPSISPSSIPSSLPSRSPTGTPTSCPEIGMFFYRFDRDNNSIPIYHTCDWLKRRSNVRRAKICKRKAFNGNYKPAQLACRDTCGTCYDNVMNPSQSPSGMPSSLPSVEPSMAPTGLPSPSPTHLPTIDPSMSPSMMPSSMPSTLPSSTTGCSDDETAEFFSRFRNNQPVYHDCLWLRGRSNNFRQIKCAATESFGGRKPAREVCVKTCNNCDFKNPSQSPSMSPTLFLSSAPSSTPTTPLPSSGPTGSGTCFEDPNAKFFLRINAGTNKPVYQSCLWLSVRDWDFISDICVSTDSRGGRGPAREVCQNTCKTC